MRQYDAVEFIAKAIINDGLALAIYLKGSIANASEDEYSNVDLYCLVKEENLTSFEKRILKYLEAYGSIIHCKKTFKRSTCVYDNDVIVNLNYHTLNELKCDENIVVVYDANNYLSNYQKENSISPLEVAAIFEDMLFQALEFRISYLRKDELNSYMLASNLLNSLGILYRAKYDSENVRLGVKKFTIAFEEKEKYLDAIKLHKLNTTLECVKMIFVLLDKYINNLPILLVEHLNLDFYAYVKMHIMSID